MLLKSLSLYFFIAILMTSFITMYLVINSRTKFTRVMVCLVIGVTIYTFGYMMEINMSTIEDALFWNRFQYLSIPFLNALWLLMGYLYTGKTSKYISLRTILLFIIPVITLILRFTNSLHHLYYSGFSFIQVSGHYLLKLEKSIWYYVQSGYILITTVLIITLFYKSFRNSSRQDRNRFRILFIASTIPLLTLITILIDPIGFGIDYSAMILPLVVILIAYSLTRYDFLEVKSLARAEIFNTTKDGMLLLNNKGIIIDFNQAAEAFFLNKGLKLTTVDLKSLIPEDPDLFDAFMSKEKSIISDADQSHFYELQTSILKGTGNQNTGHLKGIVDITERVLVEEHLKMISTIDELSQLTNRREFLNLGSRLICEAKANNCPVITLMIDIDDFKDVNDTFGHITGDEVIRRLGNILMTRFRNKDIITRFGGEEFVVLMKGIALSKALDRAEDLRREVKGIKLLESHPERKVSISIGIAVLMDNDDLDSLVHKADMAMYQSKRNGKDMVTVYKP